MVRTLVAAGVFVAAGFAGVAAAPAASAENFCETATVDTVATSPVSVGPACFTYPNATECASPFFEFDPWLGVWTVVCLPAP